MAGCNVSATVAQILFSCVPALVCAGLFLRPKFFRRPTGVYRRANLKDEAGSAKLTATAVAMLVVVPLSLLAFMAQIPLWLVGAFVLSSLAALWGAVRLFGRTGYFVTVPLLLLATVVGGSLSATWAANILAVMAGIGCAQMLSGFITQRLLVAFMFAFAILDGVIVYAGLPQGAINAISAGFGHWAASLPVFNRIEIGSFALGSGDVLYAALVAFLLISYKATKFQALAVGGIYLLMQALLVDVVVTGGGAAPATLPGAIAIGVFFLTRPKHPVTKYY